MKITPYYWIPIALIGVVLIAFVAQNFMGEDRNNEPSVSATTEKATTVAPALTQATMESPTPSSKKKADDFIHPEHQERFSAMQKRRPNTSFDVAAIEATIKRENLWTNAKQPAKELPLQQEEFTDGRQFINFDSLKIETLMPGDNLKIAIDEFKQNYEVVIDRIEQHDYENISWHGHIDAGDGQTYSVSFTRGATLTVAGIDTPEGNYVLQAHGNNGWIASSGLLFKVDPEVNDVVYPTEEESAL